MSSMYGIDSNNSNMNWMFTGAGNNTSSGNILGDYSLIQSGAYKKLMKAYYSTKNEVAAETDESVKKEKMDLSTADQDAQALNSSVSKLMSIEVSEDKRDDLKSALKDVIKDYNKLIDSGSEVDDTSVLRNVLWMTQGTSKNGGILQDIGVKIGEGNKLELDEEKFDKVNLSNIETLVKGFDSYMGRLASRAAKIASAAVNAVTESTASAYTRSGSSYSSVSVNSVIDSKT